MEKEKDLQKPNDMKTLKDVIKQANELQERYKYTIEKMKSTQRNVNELLHPDTSTESPKE